MVAFEAILGYQHVDTYSTKCRAVGSGHWISRTHQSHGTGHKKAVCQTALVRHCSAADGEELLYMDQASWPAYRSVSWVPHLSACLMTYSYLNTQSESILSIPTASGEQASQLSVRKNNSWTNIIPMSRILSFVCFTTPLVDGNFSENSFFNIKSNPSICNEMTWTNLVKYFRHSKAGSTQNNTGLQVCGK